MTASPGPGGKLKNHNRQRRASKERRRLGVEKRNSRAFRPAKKQASCKEKFCSERWTPRGPSFKVKGGGKGIVCRWGLEKNKADELWPKKCTLPWHKGGNWGEGVRGGLEPANIGSWGSKSGKANQKTGQGTNGAVGLNKSNNIKHRLFCKRHLQRA